MIRWPKIGQRVRLHYAQRAAKVMPHHGAVGAVEVASRGPGPRNAGIRIGSQLIVVTPGNLQEVKTT